MFRSASSCLIRLLSLASVSDDFLYFFQQNIGPSEVTDLPCGQMKEDGMTLTITHGIKLEFSPPFVMRYGGEKPLLSRKAMSGMP